MDINPNPCHFFNLDVSSIFQMETFLLFIRKLLIGVFTQIAIVISYHLDTKSNEKILIHIKQVIKEDDTKWIVSH